MSRLWCALRWTELFKSKNLPALKPSELVEIFWHWSQMHTVSEATFASNVGHSSVSNIYAFLRDAVTQYLDIVTADVKIGGPGRFNEMSHLKCSVRCVCECVCVCVLCAM